MNTIISAIYKARSNNSVSIPSIYIGLGIFIVAQHGYLLWGTSSTVMLGYMLLIAGIGYSLYYYRSYKPGVVKLVSYPLLVIVALAGLRCFYGSEGLSTSLMYFVLLVIMFLVYQVARIKGDELLKFIGPATALFSISILIYEMQYWGSRSSGICANPNTVACFLVVAIFLLKDRWRYLIPVAFAAILCTGSYWALFALAVTFIVKFCMGNVKIRSFVTVVIAILLVLFVFLYFTTDLGIIAWQRDTTETIVKEGEDNVGAFDNRIRQYRGVIENISIQGHGLQPNAATEDNVVSKESRYGEPVHSVPLMILDDLGIIALISWLVVMLYSIWKCARYRYALIAMFVVSCFGTFDYWWFNSLMPFHFLLIGVAAWDILEQRKEKNESRIKVLV